jgi:hypothetical protein
MSNCSPRSIGPSKDTSYVSDTLDLMPKNLLPHFSMPLHVLQIVHRFVDSTWTQLTVEDMLLHVVLINCVLMTPS